MPTGRDLDWLKNMKKTVDEEIVRKEMETLVYWRGEVEKIAAKRIQNLATLQLEIQNLLQRMQNRIKVIKSTLPLEGGKDG